MKIFSKLTVLGVVLAASASFAFADEIDLSGPGTFSSGVYTPGVVSSGSQYDVTVDTGVFTTFYNATPVFNTFNDATTPTGVIFSVENLASTQDLTFIATSENILSSAQIVFIGELYENGVALSAATMGFSENPLGTSGTEDAINLPSSAMAPEPSSLILLGTGLMGGASLLFRRRETAAVLA
jgi:PEP-CTERM motif